MDLIKTAPSSRSSKFMRRSDWFVVKHFVSSLRTAASTRSFGNIVIALLIVNSFCCRAGGVGRASVARLLRPSGIGLASMYSLSRIAAVLKFIRFRIWWPDSNLETYALWMVFAIEPSVSPAWREAKDVPAQNPSGKAVPRVERRSGGAGKFGGRCGCWLLLSGSVGGIVGNGYAVVGA